MTVPGSVYQNDTWPSTLSPKEQQNLSRYYRAMPEEFYSTTGLPVIGPDNLSAWLTAVEPFGTPAMQEFMPCSSRLTLHCWKAGLNVAFPVDYRYGWDLSEPKHHRLLKHIRTSIEFFAPRCTAWSIASSRSDPARRAAARAEEKPTLEWIASR